MSKREYLERTLKEALGKEDYDAVIGISPENVQHLSGVFIASQRMIPDRLAFAVYRRDGAPFFVVSTVVAYTARTKSWIDDVVPFKEHAVKPIDGLVEALKARGLEKGRILIETGALPTRDGDRLRAALPNLKIADAERVLNRSRMVKTPEEIDRMRGNARIWEKAVIGGLTSVKENDREMDVSRRMINNILQGGADWVPFTIFTTGEHTLMNHWVADESPIKRGEIMMVDMVGFHGGYYTDAARMAIIGEPSAAQRDAYSRMQTVHAELLKFARPGVVARDVYFHAVKVAKELGMEFESAEVGHSLGIRLHEYPILNPFEEEVLVPNMVMCIEVSQLFEGLGRFHIEDMVVLGAEKTEILTSLSATKDMLVVG